MTILLFWKLRMNFMSLYTYAAYAFLIAQKNFKSQYIINYGSFNGGLGWSSDQQRLDKSTMDFY